MTVASSILLILVVPIPTVPIPITWKLLVVPVDTNSFLNSLSVNNLNLNPSSDEWPTPKTKLSFLTILILGLINENWCVPPVEDNSIIFIGISITSTGVSPNLKLLLSTLYTKYEFLSSKPSEGDDDS